MNELIINHQKSKSRRIVRTVVGLYFTFFCGYFAFNEIAIDRFGVLFFSSIIGALMALVLLLSNTLWATKDLLRIDSSEIVSSIPSSSFKIDWTSVSKITIGVSYIVFFIDGGRKQRKLDLSELVYADVNIVKAKIIELCEHKSISYIND